MTVPGQKFLSAIVLDSSNNQIYVTNVTSATITLDAGTYYIANDSSSSDLLKEIKDKLMAEFGGVWNVYLSSDGNHKVKFQLMSGTWSIDWDHANTTFDGTILGISDLSAAFGTMGGSVKTCDYQHKHGWYSYLSNFRDSGPLPVDNVEQFVADGGQAYTTAIGDQRRIRNVEIMNQPSWKWQPKSGYTNQDWQAFLLTARTGAQVRWYPDDTNDDAYEAYSEDDGYWLSVLSKETTEKPKSKRTSDGLDYRSWNVSMLEYVE